MRFRFLDREHELARLGRALRRRDGALLCLYGRRRLGKSRLLRRLLEGRPAAYYVGDERDAALQRSELAREIAELLPGFGDVSYPSWNALFDRWWAEAPVNGVLALDEFPALVASSPELPSLLQKYLDRADRPGRHVILCGSSQRMMLGLLLDASAPLFGRAGEIVHIAPMGTAWLQKALRLRGTRAVIEHFAVWGGVPRYWELAADHTDLWTAVDHLLLDPLGILHHEPMRLLLDDLSELARAASILALVGRGCHRTSEVAGRIGVPATSLARPLSRLVQLGFLQRDVPWGSDERKAKRTLYRIADPLLRFWYRFVDPNRSRLEARQIRAVRELIQRDWPRHLGQAWEELARASVARIEVAGHRWQPARRWWSRDGELDIVAASARDPKRVLVGEAKLQCSATRARRLLAELERRSAACPALRGKRITVALWLVSWRGRDDDRIVTARDVIRADR